jgi:hypothetical protein
MNKTKTTLNRSRILLILFFTCIYNLYYSQKIISNPLINLPLGYYAALDDVSVVRIINNVLAKNRTTSQSYLDNPEWFFISRLQIAGMVSLLAVGITFFGIMYHNDKTNEYTKED